VANRAEAAESRVHDAESQAAEQAALVAKLREEMEQMRLQMSIAQVLMDSAPATPRNDRSQEREKELARVTKELTPTPGHAETEDFVMVTPTGLAMMQTG